MARILYNGKQYTITISPDLIKRMGWKKGTEIFIGKDRELDMLYMEEIKKLSKRSNKKKKPK